MKAIFRTDTGKVRASNQDSCLAKDNVFAVADGMGGHKGGETASALAVQVLKNLLCGRQPELRLLETAVAAANRRIRETGLENPDLEGMGTTLSLLWGSEAELWIAHVGDSRIYRMRGGELEQLTEDHSMVGEMLRNKLLTPEQARKHPYRNIITRAVGVDAVLTADIYPVDVQPGDLFLICSDGLSNMIEDDALLEILTAAENTDAAADRLLQTALDNGGTDNVTLVLCLAEEVTGA